MWMDVGKYHRYIMISYQKARSSPRDQINKNSTLKEPQSWDENIGWQKFNN